MAGIEIQTQMPLTMLKPLAIASTFPPFTCISCSDRTPQRSWSGRGRQQTAPWEHAATLHTQIMTFFNNWKWIHKWSEWVCVCVEGGQLPGYFSVILVSLYCLYTGLEVSTSHRMASYRHSCSSKPLLTLKSSHKLWLDSPLSDNNIYSDGALLERQSTQATKQTQIFSLPSSCF